MKRVGEQWFDDNGNSWNAARWTETEAVKFSAGLVDCFACRECVGCVQCTGCIECERCTRCSDCIRCISCIDCSEGCAACHDCIECRKCTSCYECVGAKALLRDYGIRQTRSKTLNALRAIFGF